MGVIRMLLGFIDRWQKEKHTAEDILAEVRSMLINYLGR